MAPGNRRGGKHAVKDKDLTHTKYDDYNREQLAAAVKEAGCYVKDEKKSTMARRLADRDQNSRLEERRAKQEQKDREKKTEQEIKEVAKAKESRRRAREQRNEDRYERRELGEDVSSDSEHTEDLDERGRYDAHKLTVTGGEVLSDDTWEDTCSEISVRSRNPPIAPSCRLRLYEWAYPFAPSPKMPANFCSELFPAPLTYVPLRLTAMFTGEKVTLPGLRYPAGVDPDFVPILDPLVRTAARHGHTTGLLAHATIERASTWATRTIVHGWNGRIYLSLPPRNPKGSQLDEIYHKLNTERLMLLQPTPGATDAKKDRNARFEQRSAGKRRAITEVYDASQWQPLALAFMPAQLDWEPDIKDTYLQNAEFTTDNLFYVRFPGCDLPHYCFWTRQGEWVDPTTPDPSWTPELGECRDSVEKVSLPRGSLKVRNLTAPAVQSSLTESDPAAVLVSIERALILEGLAAVLAECRVAAIASGKGDMWSVLTAQLPMLYPSSTMPHAPPMEPSQGVCVAEKITALLCDQDVLPLTGQESWTRMDDDYWEVITDRNTDELGSPSLQRPPHHHPTLLTETRDEDVPQALYRRDSNDATPILSPYPKH
ncbi:hypothetical protein E8E13_009592 [Curvularia kusanoi]|uniref:Uncharacterized protein n=1 Tax=Curvularia kusanoi TaxID=90978 RepID=A0A9P4TG30_CURKU|nr:hypothetical protein E8E13_009592 [Curvularia kusanoi]